MAVELNLDHILEGIADERARTASRLLLNVVEELKGENHFLREENQRLRDEINRLKGEQGKPTFKPGKLTRAIVTAASAPQAEHIDSPSSSNPSSSNPSSSNPSSSNHSSEKERHQPKNWHKGSKKDKIAIDQEQKVTLNPAELPKDVILKNYQKTVIQDLELKTRNILFHREQWYSPSLLKTYTAPLPAGYEGQFVLFQGEAAGLTNCSLG